MIQNLLSFLANLHSPEGIAAIIQSAGLGALIAIVFAETGLLVGFFLPGDSLLVTAGVMASTSFSGGEPLLNMKTLVASLITAAVLGDQLGFLLGKKIGPKIFDKPDNRFFKKKYAIDAHRFYLKYGSFALVLARFVPIMRTFVPFIAGVGEMPYKKFILFSVMGGTGWVLAMTSLGYFIGQGPLGQKLHWVILTVIGISLLPLLIGALKLLLKSKTSPKDI